MLGIILRELKKFVEARHDRSTWNALLRTAGIEGRVFLPISEYSDAEMMAIVTAASTATGTPVETLLEDFGEFIVPDLFHIYRTILDPTWRTLDLIEHTETVIHHAVRLRDANAQPPALAVTRLAPNAVRVVYRSPRRLCAIAKGITRGVAAHYGEGVRIEESACMHHGAAACILEITTLLDRTRRSGAPPRDG